ncbi:MAG: S41 family peptidase, partial [Leadbetterella sp.]
AAKYHNVGVLVGQETAGAYEGGNGNSYVHLELPHSKIAIGTPLVYYQMNVNEKNYPKGRGTLPDHQVPFTVQDVMQHKDPQLEFVKKLIWEKSVTAK